MNIFTNMTPGRQAAIHTLAVIGFIALVVGGIALAVYSTRFVPTVVNNIGAAAVYLGSLFNRPANNDLSVVPTPPATTTIPFDDEDATTTPSPTTKPPAPAVPPTQTTPVRPTPTYPVGGTVVSVPAPLYGLSDLSVTVTARGYLTTSSANSFVSSATVPEGERPAVKFTVKNIGTNVSGSWFFNVDIPLNRSVSAPGFDECDSIGNNTQRCSSFAQQSLSPGEYIDYTIGFDRARSGANQPIVIDVDPDNKVVESRENNNDISLTVTVLD